ncbi:hypothetical protein ANN_21973 [Periplaneta americana]|uniref:Uncharacterized protein n=1 Tax=Periplaneta americana TaxID=6978 RepID=A0ABQ8S7C0_PERAM|nr:hypothetical protein ANN_21973 [Periplaneta americana]
MEGNIIKRQVLHRQAREILLKAYNYFININEQNSAGHHGAGRNVANAQKTTAEACGVGLRTVQRIVREGNKSFNVSGTATFRSPGKHPRREKTVSELDDFNKSVLRRTVLDMYFRESDSEESDGTDEGISDFDYNQCCQLNMNIVARSGERNIIKYVIAFCDEEKQTGQYLFPINQATKRATDITDRSELLKKKIRREGVCAGDEKLESPEKNRPRELLIIVKGFENKVLKKIFRAKRNEATGEWRKLHNTELHALYSSPDIIMNIKSRRLRWARMGEFRNAYKVLVGRPEGKRPLGRPRRRWEDNIKIDLREVGYDGTVETGLILLRIGTNGGLM